MHSDHGIDPSLHRCELNACDAIVSRLPPTHGGHDEQHAGAERHRHRKPASRDRRHEARGRVVPVSDVDRAKRFYEGSGWRFDGEIAVGDDFRVIQFTLAGLPRLDPFGTGVTSRRRARSGAVLVVSDIEEARGASSAAVWTWEVYHTSWPYQAPESTTPGRVAGPAPRGSHLRPRGPRSVDPDGNGWLFQEITARLPGRVDPSETTFSSAGDLAKALERASAAHGEHEKANWERPIPTGPPGTPSTWCGEAAGVELPT